MGIFRRRQAVAVADYGQWLLDSGEVLVADGDDMDDDGCAGETAYGARFWLGDATMTIWVYPAFAAPDAPGNYQLGYRVEHATTRWSASLYDCDLEVFSDSLDDADAGAEGAAEVLATLGEQGAPAALAPYFDWDGTAW